MSNGIASFAARTGTRARFSQATPILWVALILPIAGCHTGSASPPTPQATVDAPYSRNSATRSRVDAGRNRVWSLTDHGVSVRDVGAPQRILEVALPAWQWAGTPYSCPPDLAIGPKGEAVVTSNVVPTIWRIDPDTLAVSVHDLVLDADLDKDLGFTGLAYSAEHGAFFAISELHGSLWRIDSLLRRGQKIQLSAPIGKACGVAVRSRVAQRQAHRLSGLCVHAPQGPWTVELAPDLRAAYVRAVTCVEAQTSLPREGK